MSSFRIDRQYVSFQTAETQPVFATPTVQKKADDLATQVHSQLNSQYEDPNKLYDEIFEKLRREHAEQAENMLVKAKSDALELVAAAKQQAALILEQANSEAKLLLEEKTAALENAAAQRKDQERDQLLALEDSLRRGYDTLLGGMQGEVIALVMEIVRKVVGVKMAQSDDIFLGLVREALESLKQTGAAVIRVSPEDYQRYFGSERRQEPDFGDMKVTITEEPDFKMGDLVVESDGEMIDLSIDRQLDQIEKAFQN